MPNVQNSSKLEAVTVCIYYSNFLKYCVNNKKYLDRWIIVTVEDDVDTIEICKAYSLEFVFSTRAFNEDLVSNRNEKCHRDNWVMHLDCYSTLSREVQEFISTIPFNGTALSKGKAINDGMARLDRSGWLLHLDCDIVLPNNSRKFVDKIPQTKNNKESLFGLRGRRI